MTITVYKSTDTSAPSLSGTAGSLIALLDAVLVNGYGSKAAAGWTKPYTGTNKAAYRLGTGSTGHYLRVVDDGTTSAAYARINGYETMSDVDTGTNQMPTTAQVSGGMYVHKSTTADATARPWMIIACERAFYLFTEPVATALGTAPVSSNGQYFFGDIKSYKSGDAYQCAIIASVATSVSSSNMGTALSTTSSNVTTTGHYVSRPYTQAGGSLAVAKTAYRTITSNATSVLGTNNLAGYPNPVTGSMDLSPVQLSEPSATTYAIRGQYAGLYEPQHNLPGNAYDTFSGTGALAGITFMLVTAYSTGSQGRLAVQTSGTWY